MPTVEIEKGYKINYLDKGKGKNLVYIHGYLGSSWLYEDFVDYFSKNYRVIAIDHLGHGKSDKPHNPEAYNLLLKARYFMKSSWPMRSIAPHPRYSPPC